jgi:pyruvate/2-oxoglutarate dehydrogenase complex dihydrolipoamide dehydrogenase (E3) component
VVWSGEHRCFIGETDARGKTGHANVFVAGEMRGPMSSNAAAEQGVAAAQALIGTAS